MGTEDRAPAVACVSPVARAVPRPIRVIFADQFAPPQLAHSVDLLATFSLSRLLHSHATIELSDHDQISSHRWSGTRLNWADGTARIGYRY